MIAKDPSESISVACPQCDYETQIRINHLHRGQTCRNCGISFRVNDKGRCVVDRSRGMRTGQRTSRMSRYRDQLNQSAQRAFRPLSESWQLLSRQVRRVIVGTVASFGLLICGAWLWTAWMTTFALEEEPQSLTVRSEVVGRALVYGDAGLLAGFTSPDTLNDAKRWLKQARHDHWGQYDSAGNLAHVRTRLMFKNEGNREASILCEISAPTNGGVRGSNATVEQMLFWTLGQDGNWFLDGTRTWKEFQRAHPD